MIPPRSAPDWPALAALPGVAQAVASSRAMVDRLLTSRSVVRRQAEVAAESALRGARASAELESGGLPGALRVYAELPRLRSVWRSSPRQALARLHLLASADLVDAELLGRPADPAAALALARVGDLMVAAPFAGGNGIVARAAYRLVLAGRGLDPGLLSVVEVGHRELGDYAEAADSYRAGGPDEVARWLRHCAGAVEAGAREALAVAESLARG